MWTQVNLLNVVLPSYLEANLRRTLPPSREQGKIIKISDINRNYSTRGNIILAIVLYPLELTLFLTVISTH